MATYRNNNFGAAGILVLGGAFAACALSKQLLKLHAVGVADFIANDHVDQLVHEVHERLVASRRESQMPRAISAGDLERRFGSRLQGLWVKRVNVDLIRSQVRNEQVLARGIHDGLVRVRLAGVRLTVDQLQLGRIGNVPSGECIVTT